MEVFILTAIDGTFSPISQMPFEREWDDMKSVGVARTDGSAKYLNYSPSMVENFKILLNYPHVTGYWLSNWRGETHGVNQVMGLDLEEAGEPEFEMGGFSWKEDVVRRAYESGMAIIWIDNDPGESMVSWMERDTIDARFLHINTNASHGITPSHLVQMEEFIAMHA